MKLIKVRGIAKLDKSKLLAIRGGKECKATVGGTTYYCATYHIVIDPQSFFEDETADSLTKHV